MRGTIRRDAAVAERKNLMAYWGRSYEAHLRHGGQIRQDTNTALFQRSLAVALRRSYDRKYPGLQWRSALPEQTEFIPAGAGSVLQQGYDIMGRATYGASSAKDVSLVTLQGTEQAVPVATLRTGWTIGLDDIAAAEVAGVELNTKGLDAARLILETEVDRVMWLGNVPHNLRGFAALDTKTGAIPPATPAAGAGVQLFAPGSPAGFTGGWDGAATAAQIMADATILRNAVMQNTPWIPDTLLVSPEVDGRLRALLVTGGSEGTMLSWIEKNLSVRITPCWRLSTASTTTPGQGRCIMMMKDPLVVQPLVALDPVLDPVAWDGVAYLSVFRTRIAGVADGDTTGMVYADMA
jgi:hypothetical protein